MTTTVVTDNPANASLARGGEGDAGMQNNYLTKADLDRIIREQKAENDRRYNALQAKFNQTEQYLTEANQRYAELQTASQYDDEDERREAIAAMREQQASNQSKAKAEWAERTLNAQTRAIKALAQANIPWGYKAIDWAADAQTPEEVADRIIASIPNAREVMRQETDSYRRQNTPQQNVPQPQMNTTGVEDTIVDTGSPSGNTPEGINNRFWSYSKEEREKIRKLSRRRNVDGSSALSVTQL